MRQTSIIRKETKNENSNKEEIKTRLNFGNAT